MSDEVPPLDPSEPIIRRIAKAPGFYNAAAAPPFERGAFSPNDQDTDGISLYIERETSVADLLAAAPKDPSCYVVVRLTVADFQKLELTVRPDVKEGDLPGHVLIPELNRKDYKDPLKSGKLKEKLFILSRIANDNIIHGLT
jgi:hypothetical protein